MTTARSTDADLADPTPPTGDRFIRPLTDFLRAEAAEVQIILVVAFDGVGD